MANLRCEDVMTRNPRCAAPGDTLVEAIRIMKELDVGFVPVAERDTGRLLGVLTDRDLALSLLRDMRPSELTVNDVMTRDPVACRPGDDILDAARLMEEHQIRRIPVVDNDNILLGVIATADIARRAGRSGDLEAELPDLIESISAPTA